MTKLCRVPLAWFGLVLFALLALTVTVSAQVQNGQFQGTVLDQSGAAVPNATITVTHEGTGQKFSATTSNSGFYVLPQLPLGQYRVMVEAQGFKSLSANQGANAGVIQRLDFKLPIGQRTETVEVTGEASAIQTEDSRLGYTVTGALIANLPLNGRNVYDLIQLPPGAVNVDGVLTENGENTVVNGLRENFNGFLVNGTSNKGLSGGANNQPIQDTVAEFQLLTLNQSAQYGNSAGSITNLVTKSGSNDLHGSLWWFVRNDIFDANTFFNNQAGEERPKLRFNQFGGTIGGPIIKDKLFFFGAYQGDRFITSTLPAPRSVESPEWRQAVITALPNSVAALLYRDFAPTPQGNPAMTLAEYLAGENSGSGFTSVADFTDPNNFGDPAIAARMAAVLALFDPNAPFIYDTVSVAPSKAEGNLFDGNEFSARIDINPTSNNQIFLQANWARQNDLLPANPGIRGFFNPTRFVTPYGTINWVHTFSPTVVNEAKAGYTGSVSKYVPSIPGVPSIYIGDGLSSMGFGSYSGYPQFFKENIYNYADMLSIKKGNHNLKIGAEVRRNIENSEFNVGRPSYYFYDPLYFAADAPYGMGAGTDPGFINSEPSQLATNVRHFRNIEFGGFLQDDWKISRRLTLNLGIRYDLFTRHNELNNLATTFILGPGNSIIDNITTGAGQIADANSPAFPGNPACDATAIGSDGVHTIKQLSVMAGVCGPGGFSPSDNLGAGDRNNFSPRVGFAWDVFGTGKTALRGGFGVSYEGTLYNPLSNSRWNPPYYSFNQALDFDTGTGCGTAAGCTVAYGPQTPGNTPSYTGPADPANRQGNTSATATGNLMGWNPNNPNQAVLTGIVFPEGIRDPYVYNYYLGIQQEIVPRLSMEVNYVGTTAHKLFRAQQVNRVPGGALPVGTCVTDIFGRNLCGRDTGGAATANPNGRLNPNYGRLRVWQNVNNSNYNALQASLKKQTSRGVTLEFNYTWSHAIDNGSTWHSGATSSNTTAAGEGYSADQTMPQLDRSNAIFDTRHRVVFTYAWELPLFKGTGGFLEAALGGWSFNGLVNFQSGAHFSPFCSGPPAQCDFNRDFETNDRPDTDLANFGDITHDMWANGWGPDFILSGAAGGVGCTTHFCRPALGSPGNLGRNTFLGPNFWTWNPSLFKSFKFTERVNLQFRTEAFNVLNRVNFKLPGAEDAGHHNVRDANFGQAGGTFNPRNLQFGLKLSF